MRACMKLRTLAVLIAVAGAAAAGGCSSAPAVSHPPAASGGPAGYWTQSRLLAVGAIRRGDVASISLADIRLGGPPPVRDLLASAHCGRWVIINATEYSDLETVACGCCWPSGPASRSCSAPGPRSYGP